MRLVKNQSKWNVTKIDGNDLSLLVGAIGFFNDAHEKVGKGYMSVTMECDEPEKVLESSSFIDVLRKHKVINTPTPDQG